MHTSNRMPAKLCIVIALTTALSGCHIIDVVEAHAEPCGIAEASGWTVGRLGAIHRPVGRLNLDVTTWHVSAVDAPAVRINIRADSYAFDGVNSAILFNPSGAYLDIEGEKVQASESLNYPTYGEDRSRCGGNLSVPVDLKICRYTGVAFQTGKSIKTGFQLHVGALQLDDKTYEVPPIKFCYVPRKIVPVHFHI